MARLPIPGQDNGTWGDILNEYLSQALKPDGTIKDGSITNAAIASDAVTATNIADGSITESLLDSAVQAKLDQVAPTWATLSGRLQLLPRVRIRLLQGQLSRQLHSVSMGHLSIPITLIQHH